MQILKSYRLLFAVLFLASIGLLGLNNQATARGNNVPAAVNLQQDGITATEKGIPVLLEFAMHRCPFCEEVEEEVLRPMLISGDYDNKVIIRKVMVDEDTEITDFNGTTVSYEALASRYRVYVTPTLVLVKGNGEALGLDMVGVTTIDFYGAYLDQNIDQALRWLPKAKEVSQR